MRSRLAAAATIAVVCTAVTGCGGSSGIRSASTRPVTPSAIERAQHAMVRAQCTQPGGEQRTGSGFQVGAWIVTASHVVEPCAAGSASATVGAGLPATVAVNDPAHDYALLRSGLSLPRLSLETDRVSVGQQVVVLGIPGDQATPNAFPSPVYGSVVATGQPVTLSGEGGETPERLTDTIEVQIAAGSALPGNSGGPAIDATGRVVGVFEGATSHLAILTPAGDFKLPGR
jgi:S1-C subfamily serine protease